MKIRFIRPVVFIVSVFVLTFSARADTEQHDITPGNMLRAWRNWVEVNKVGASSIAISFDGKIIATDGYNLAPDESAPVASLTKAITGICLLQLLQGGQYNLNTPIGEILGDVFEGEKIKGLEQKLAIKIGMLLSHTSGFKKDITQHKGLNKVGNFDQPNIQKQALRAIQQKLAAPPGKKYYYNNGNYALLGLIIEQLSGGSYEQTCLDQTLRPAGVEDAELNPEWRIMSSWGGWRLSAVDYARFVNTYFGKNKVLGNKPRDYGAGRVSEEVNYGPGFFWRYARDGHNFWHFGRWSWNYPHSHVRFGAYFSRYVSGWSMSVNYDIKPSEKQALALDRALQEAAHKQ